MSRICLFGGSFDPIHLGHMAIASAAVRECVLDQVVFLPCARSPLKTQSPLASDEARLAMLRLAVEDVPWAVVDDVDLRLPPPSWSWRLVEHMQAKSPGTEFFWLMGADQWEALEQWVRWEYLASMVTFIVHHRGGECLPDRPGTKAVFLEGDHPASASALRAALKPEWLHKKVYDYIVRQGLYSA